MLQFQSRCPAVALAVVLLVWGAPGSAQAGPRDVRVFPVEVEAVPEGVPVDLTAIARSLDGVFGEAVQDYGLSVLPLAEGEVGGGEEMLVEKARDAWVVAPTISLHGAEVALRLVVVSPGSGVLWVRREHFPVEQAEVRALGSLRELLEPRFSTPEAGPEAAFTPVPLAPSTRSEGRAVLALHTAALGGYLGYSLQRTSGRDDARLTYPLAALGAGVGLGSAMIVADEWDIDVARAWYLGAGMVWPGIATLLLVDPADDDESGPRHLYGIAGAFGGLTLATAGLALGDVDAGGAAMTHSGAVLGLLLGGLSELIVEGDAEARPKRGMGIGALVGVVGAGAVASQFELPSATDFLFVDLSALLGGLAGAAVGTPILVTQDPSPTRDRLWLSTVVVGTLTGAGLSYWLTTAPPEPSAPARMQVQPHLGWGDSLLGFGVSGSW